MKKVIFALAIFVLLSASVSAQQSCEGDFNNDSFVGFPDFILFAQNFNKIANETTQVYDLVNDSAKMINFADFILFSQNFGVDCSLKTEEVEESSSPLRTKPTIDCLDYSSEEQRNECLIIKAGIGKDGSLCNYISDSGSLQNEGNLRSVCRQKADYAKYDDFTQGLLLSGIKNFVVYEGHIYIEGEAGRRVLNLEGKEVTDPLLGGTLPVSNINQNCLVNNCEGQSFSFSLGAKGYVYGPDGLFANKVSAESGGFAARGKVKTVSLRLPPQITQISQVFIDEDRLYVLASRPRSSGYSYSSIGELLIKELEENEA